MYLVGVQQYRPFFEYYEVDPGLWARLPILASGV